MRQQFAEFFRDALGGDDYDLRGDLLSRGEGGWVDAQFEPRRDSHGPEHAQLVFGEAGHRVADGPEYLRFEIDLAADEVVELPRDGVEEHPVNGEVAALGVEFRGRKRDGLGPPSIDVDAVRAERGDFNREVLAIVAARADHFDDAERGTDRNGTAEQVRDLLRPRVGGDVVVVGREAEEFVAHAATGPQRPEPGLLQRANHLGREFAFGHGLCEGLHAFIECGEQIDQRQREAWKDGTTVERRGFSEANARRGIREHFNGANPMVDDPDEPATRAKILLAFQFELGLRVARADDFHAKVGAPIADLTAGVPPTGLRRERHIGLADVPVNHLVHAVRSRRDSEFIQPNERSHELKHEAGEERFGDAHYLLHQGTVNEFAGSLRIGRVNRIGFRRGSGIGVEPHAVRGDVAEFVEELAEGLTWVRWVSRRCGRGRHSEDRHTCSSLGAKIARLHS